MDIFHWNVCITWSGDSESNDMSSAFQSISSKLVSPNRQSPYQRWPPLLLWIPVVVSEWMDGPQSKPETPLDLCYCHIGPIFFCRYHELIISSLCCGHPIRCMGLSYEWPFALLIPCTPQLSRPVSREWVRRGMKMALTTRHGLEYSQEGPGRS